MSRKTIHNQPSTRESVLARIDQFLADHSDIDAESFGYYAINDTSLVARLRNGGDITTRKLDLILNFLYNPVIKRKKRHDEKEQ